MATNKGFFETVDGEIVKGQTFFDLTFWALGAVLLLDLVTGGMLFETYFSNFGLTEGRFTTLQVLLLFYCGAMVFTEGRHVKNVINGITFWTLLIVMAVTINPNSGAAKITNTIKDTLGSSGAVFKYNANVANPDNPTIVEQQPVTDNRQANITAWEKKALLWGYCPTNILLTKAMLNECRTKGNNNNHWRVNCGTQIVHNPPGKNGCPTK